MNDQSYDNSLNSGESAAPQVNPLPPGTQRPPVYAAPSKSAGTSILRILMLMFGSVMLLFVGGVLGFIVGSVAGRISASSTQMTGNLTRVIYQEGETDEVIAMIPVYGIIEDNMAMYVRDVVRQIGRDRDVRAVVLRINSGGGMVGASDNIAWQLNKLRTDMGLPVYASYGPIAASGAYYISAKADRIFAEPTTITGSIGVIAQILTFEGLLTEKLGITPEVITAQGSPRKDTANTVLRSWTEEDRSEVRELLNEMHRQFVEVVVEGRSDVASAEHLRQVSDGRVFMADKAIDAGLVDEVAYLDEVLELAKKEAGFENQKMTVVIYRYPPTLLELFGAGAMGHAEPTIFDVVKRPQNLQSWLDHANTPRMMYLYQ